jgi:transcriptional regulator with XRE-family HTH domain
MMRITSFEKMGDEAILAELGERLARHRLNRNTTQADVAREAGVARRTVSRLENGHSVDSQSLIRILRALGLVDRLEQLVPSVRPSPLAMAERKGRPRERARRRESDPDSRPDETGGWVWPDESDQ